MARGDKDMLMMAAGVAISKVDKRTFRLGAVGLRSDGVLVSALNGPTRVPCPDAHAEARLISKLSSESTVWVARVIADGKLAMARPCKFCMCRLRSKRVSRIVYTISDDEYGVIDVGSSGNCFDDRIKRSNIIMN
jgi:tRNA(Arg) A34 adenosine deaminase TadA